MANRAHGEGTIYKRTNGSWRAQITIEGQRLSFTAKTRREAQEWLKKVTGQVDQGLTFEGSKTSFGQVLDAWMGAKENKLRGATLEQYRRMIRKYIKPQLGKIPAKDLNAARLQAHYHQLAEAGTGRRTIEVVHSVLHGSLKHAQRLGLVTQNWAALVEVPRPERREMLVWDENQVSAFLASNPGNVFYRLAFATGMRRGELIGLQWQDLDWQSGSLMVRRQVFEPEGGGWRFQEPKTARGRRVIRLGPGLIDALRRQYNQVLPLARSLAGERWQEHDLIFPSSIGTPRNGYEVSKEFRALAAAGLPRMRFHDIRHTAASIMLLHGEPPVRVAAILGQSLAVLLDTYAHYIPDDQERAASLMDAITSPAAIDLLHPIAPENTTENNELQGRLHANTR